MVKFGKCVLTKYGTKCDTWEEAVQKEYIESVVRFVKAFTRKMCHGKDKRWSTYHEHVAVSIFENPREVLETMEEHGLIQKGEWVAKQEV